MSPDKAGVSIPPAAKWLGAAGAIPFLSLTAASLLLEGELKNQATFMLAAYGAVILSFLGGIHWGVATVTAGETASNAGSHHRFAFSVVPSLIGWMAQLLPMAAGLPVLAVAFALMLVVDLRAVRQAHMPAWYSKLRIPLTIAVVVSLTLGAFAWRGSVG